jgi:hypothetical protein
MAGRHSKRDRKAQKRRLSARQSVRKNPHGVREHGRLVDRPDDAAGVEHAGNHIARCHPGKPVASSAEHTSCANAASCDASLMNTRRV